MKKILTLALCLTVALAAVPMTGSAATGKTGDAGIIFQEGDGPEIVEPPVEPNPNPVPNIKSKDIHFGTHHVASTDMTYYSETSAPSEDLKHAGLVVSNNSKEKSWTALVGMTGFFIDDDYETMDGFELQLVPVGEIEGEGLGVPSLKPTIAPLYGDEVTIEVMESGDNASFGMYGINFAGELLVLMGTSDEGTAKAVMTWTMQSA